MRGFIAAIAIVGFFGTSVGAFAQMNSTNYEIRWDTVGSGGNDTSTSSSYILRDTVGNTAIGDGTATSYSLRSGYRLGVFDQVIAFSLFSQQNASSTAATAVSGNTITCSPVNFDVGDMIALVQDVGASQVSALGQVASLGANSITVDSFKNGATAPTIDGTNDVVYLLSGSSADLDTLDASSVSTSIIGMEVSSDVDRGYVVQVRADGSLRADGSAIDGVSDGTVTAGSEEYGGRSSDTSLSNSTFDSTDTAFTTTFQDIADASSAKLDDRNFLTLKGSVSSSTSNGAYAQVLTLIVSGNF